MSRDVPNRLRPLLVALLSAGWILASVAVGSSVASAHAEVVGSDPADGSTLEALPPRVSVEFSEELGAEFARAQVRSPAGGDVEIEPGVQGRRLVVPMDTVRPDAGPGAAGEYVVDFRVTSADGHPVSGSVTFALAGDSEPTTTPTTTPTTAPTMAPAPDTESVEVTATAVAATPVSGPLTPSESERPFAIVLAFLATAAVAVLAVVRLRRGGPDQRGGPEQRRPDRDEHRDDGDEPRS